MKKENVNNRRKPLSRALAAVLSLVMTLSLTMQAFAGTSSWPATGVASGNRYMQDTGTLSGDGFVAKKYGSFGGFINVYGLPKGSEDSDYIMTPTTMDFGSLKGSKNNTADLELGKSYDFSKPVRYNVIAEDGRTFFAYALAAETTSKDTWTEADTQELLGMAELFADTFHTIYQTIGRLKSASVAVGSYHPANADMLSTLGYWLGMGTAYYTLRDDENPTMDGNRLFDSYESVWQTGGEEAVSFMRQYLETYVERNGYSQIDPAALRIIYEQIVPQYLAYAENYCIAEPAITRVSIGGSVGSIDAEKREVTVKLPKGTDRTGLSVEIETAEGVKARYFAGSVSGGTMAYQVIPYDPAYGTEYSSLGATWAVYIEEGTPDNQVTSFAVTLDGVTRYATIDGAAKTIVLNLPVGTDLSTIKPMITHTGTETTMDSGSFDFTNSDSSPLALTVKNSTFDLTTVYQVTITAKKSPENRILFYQLAGAEGIINGDTIAVTIPYATDLGVTEPEIELSEFAVLAAPASLKVGNNTYTVTAEDDSVRIYTVTITRTAVAVGNQITSFTYGAAKGSIDQVNGTISLELPAGTAVTFAPVITVSDFAAVSPASGETQDFSKPVTYTVTAQNGAVNTYTVTVTVSQEQAENPYRDDMQGLVNKIINRYRDSASDDWEYMNVGFYSKTLNNMSSDTIAERIAKLDSTTNVAMTNIDRKIMTLTANGIDCSKLSKYNDGEPYYDKNGNAVDDLAAILYNYSGGWTINGPTFALIALDMGNYTIPENALWTREKLLETLLDHVYLSDGFGLDMVTMMMQAMAPYQNDPVYGTRVKAKLEEGLKIVLDSFGTDPYGNPFGVQWGGVYTSEGASQIVCALSAMGIDIHSDVRLNNGTDSVLTSFLNYANYDKGYFHHTNTVRDNAMATYQGCYATQWYLGFLENGGAGHPYSLYYQRFDFSRKLSEDASITSFTLEGKNGVITEGSRNTITVALPTGTPLNDLYPQIGLAEGAQLIAPDTSSGVTFIEGVETPYTVEAEDGKTRKTYYVTVRFSDEETASGAELYVDTLTLKDANILRDLDILGKDITTKEDGSTDIELFVNAGVNTKKLLLTARISYRATATPALDGKKGMDLTDWTAFTITSGDTTAAQVYRIKVTPRTQASISAFRLTIDGTVYDGVIDNSANTITISGVDDTKLTSATFEPDITLGPDTLVCSPASGIAQDFSRSVSYIVAGGDKVVSRTYTVTVLNQDGNLISTSGSQGGSSDVPTVTSARITAFSVLGEEGVIDDTAGTITVTLPVGSNVSAVAPMVTVPSGAVVSPVSGEVVNLSSPLIYTVTLGEESKSYTVSVKYQRSISQQLWDKVTEDNDVTEHQISRDPHGLKGGWKD